MPKQYKKGKSNRLTHKTSVWTLVAKSRFGAIEDLRSMKAKEKLLRSVETKPNIPKKIEPIVNESVDKKIEYDDLQAYQEQQQLKRQLELDKIRAEENKKREQQQLEVERLKKGFGKPHSTYRESKYIYWCNPFESINKGKLGHSQSWRNKKDKKYEYYG